VVTSPGRWRRRLLGAVAALLALPAGAAQDRIVWSDIRLLDGSTLPAARLNGSVVVVQIWASWCPFCARQNPHIQKLHEAVDGKGMTVLTFSIDQTEQAARDYLKKRGYSFAAAMAGPQLSRWFGKRRTLPELYVVDAQGRVVLREEGEMFAEDIAALARFAARVPARS
jgi:thiol-disulfide isomerase/thioredoxin